MQSLFAWKDIVELRASWARAWSRWLPRTHVSPYTFRCHCSFLAFLVCHFQPGSSRRNERKPGSSHERKGKGVFTPPVEAWKLCHGPHQSLPSPSRCRTLRWALCQALGSEPHRWPPSLAWRDPDPLLTLSALPCTSPLPPERSCHPFLCFSGGRSWLLAAEQLPAVRLSTPGTLRGMALVLLCLSHPW